MTGSCQCTTVPNTVIAGSMNVTATYDGQHDELALREVHHADGVVDEHEAERDERIDRPDRQPADEQLHVGDRVEMHGQPETFLTKCTLPFSICPIDTEWTMLFSASALNVPRTPSNFLSPLSDAIVCLGSVDFCFL